MKKEKKHRANHQNMNRNQSKIQHKKRNKKQRNQKPILFFTTICVICVAICSIVFFRYQIHRYEDGILDVCATQQDTYVQLVVDQINLKDNQNDETIIHDILGTLDASSNKYWTFSKNQSMLYVKDVIETNKYQGITAASYYESESAKAFLDGLQQTRVTHAEIMINEKSYIASGVIFLYNQNQYKLCLLTNKSVLLDNNSYLGMRTQLWTFVCTLILIILLVPMIFAYQIRKLQLQADTRMKELSVLNNSLVKMNDRLSEHDLHDTRNNVWKQETIPVFLEKIIDRQIIPLTLVHLHCNDQSSREQFLMRAHITLNKKVLRFEYRKCDLLLIFVGIEKEMAMRNLIPITTKDVYLDHAYVIDQTAEIDLNKIYAEFGLEEEE